MIQCKHYNAGVCKAGAGGGKPSFGFCFQICRGSALLQPKALQWAELRYPDRRQVITGTDANQEWLLEHWYNAYKAHCDYQITFVDFGMSADARSWCEQRGNVVEVKENIPPMYRKPVSFLKSEYGYNVWLDLDTEVRGDISPMFKFQWVHDAKFRLDHEWTLRTHEADHLQAGVCAFRHGSELIRRWASYSALGLENRRYCPDKLNVQDQQVLAWVRRKFGMSYQYLPHEYNWMVFEKPLDVEPVVVHWAGTEGKTAIREKLATGRRKYEAGRWAKLDITVTTKEEATRLLEGIQVESIISIGSPGEAPPPLEKAKRALGLHYHDDPREWDSTTQRRGKLLTNYRPPTDADIEKVIAFAKATEGKLLIHCWAGHNRSPAVAIVCAATCQSARDAAKYIKAIRPHAAPNRTTIAIGDRLLGLGGELITAVEQEFRENYEKVG